MLTPCNLSTTAPMHHIPHPLPSLPGRTQFHSPSTRHALAPCSSPHARPAHVSGQCWRLLGFQVTLFGVISRCMAASSHGTTFELRSCSLVLTRLRPRRDENKVSRSVRTHSFALTAAHPSPCARSNACCVHPKRPCIASRTHCARPGPVPLPQHADALVPSSSPQVCCAHVSGLG